MSCRSIVLLALGLMAVGCASSETIAQRNQQRCVNRGLQPGTKDFNDCLAQVETDRLVRMDDRRLDMLRQPANPTGR
jgi:hypothetical protein